MDAYRKILVVLNRNLKMTNALRQAVRLARITGAELHLDLFEHDSAIEPAGPFGKNVMIPARQAYIAEREDWLRELRERLGRDGLRVHSEVVWEAQLHEVIVRRALAIKADLVIKDVQYEGGLRKVLFAPLDWKLLRLCPAPLWLVKSDQDEAPRQIVAAVDTARPPGKGSELNDEIIKAAQMLAGHYDAPVDLVHVQRASAIYPLPPSHAVPADVIEDLHRHDGKLFEAFAAKYGVPPERRHHVHGLVSDAVTRFAAARRASVVVVGTTHRTGLDRILMGSMAELILDQIGCDVLAIKPPGFAKDAARYVGLPVSQSRKAA